MSKKITIYKLSDKVEFSPKDSGDITIECFGDDYVVIHQYGGDKIEFEIYDIPYFIDALRAFYNEIIKDVVLNEKLTEFIDTYAAKPRKSTLTAPSQDNRVVTVHDLQEFFHKIARELL